MLKMTAVLGADKATLKQIASVRKAWVDAMQTERKTVEALYKRTTENWHTDVQFKSKIKSTDRELYVEVWTVNRIYWFVHESIKTMYAVLSGPNHPAGKWKGKTTPGSLRSTVGQGQVVAINPKVKQPLYPARKFTKTIIEKREKGFQKLMQSATQKGARKATGG
jgi:hypothetical protein